MDETPSIVEDLALGAFRMVKQRLALELDFTADTLPILDHYLRALAEPDEEAPDDNLVRVVAPCAGAYFGEVVRRTLPGMRWRLPSGDDAHDYQAWRLEGEAHPIAFNPIGAALEAIYAEPADGWSAHIDLPADLRGPIEAALDAQGGVREEDYFRLAVRHEVLEQVLSLLSRR